jgi:hypothetical protein
MRTDRTSDVDKWYQGLTVLGIIMTSLGWMLWFTPAVGQACPANTFCVTSTAEGPDANLGDGICATSTNDCTVRAAFQGGHSTGRNQNDSVITCAGSPFDQ